MTKSAKNDIIFCVNFTAISINESAPREILPYSALLQQTTTNLRRLSKVRERLLSERTLLYREKLLSTSADITGAYLIHLGQDSQNLVPENFSFSVSKTVCLQKLRLYKTFCENLTIYYPSWMPFLAVNLYRVLFTSELQCSYMLLATHMLLNSEFSFCRYFCLAHLTKQNFAVCRKNFIHKF